VTANANPPLSQTTAQALQKNGVIINDHHPVGGASLASGLLTEEQGGRNKLPNVDTIKSWPDRRTHSRLEVMAIRLAGQIRAIIGTQHNN
jgi:hypothetical protein